MEMNDTVHPVLILTCNNLELSKRAIESARNQSIPTRVCVLDNGSGDGTLEWLETQHDLTVCAMGANTGVSNGWNHGLTFLFRVKKAPHVLVMGNDTEISPDYYERLLTYPFPFLTGIHDQEWDGVEWPPVPHPDFSSFLIREDCWRRVGPFDVSMFNYASDCDYHARAHALKVEMMKVPVPFKHEKSATTRLASEDMRERLEYISYQDRTAFANKYGFLPSDPQYAELFR